jgi:mannose-6-phosphate isomerase-like protein (cupin superfamily)
MIRLIPRPTVIQAAGNKPKKILEYIGRVNTNTDSLSIARMKSPQGWEEPAQTPEFDEYTLVLEGTLVITTREQEILVKKGEAVIVGRGESVRYSTPLAGGAEYIAVCLPAFSPDLVNREEI